MDTKGEIHSKSRVSSEIIEKNASSDTCSLVQAIIHALHEDEGLPALIGLLAEFLHSGIGIVDVNGDLMVESYSSYYTSEQKDLLGRHIVLQSSSERLNIYQISAPLVYSVEKSGVLSVARLDAPFAEADHSAVNNTVGLFCIKLAQEKKLAEFELRLKGNFIEDLVFARYSNPESIIGRARALNYNIMKPHRVLVAKIENPQQLAVQMEEGSESAWQLKTDIVKMIQSTIYQAVKGMAIVSKDEFILLIEKNKGDNDIKDTIAMCEKLVGNVESSVKAKMYVGIGSVCNKLSDFSESYRAAKKALEIGEYMITEGQVRSFEQFKVHALFLSTLKPKELYNYAREQLDALLTYDQIHGTEFLKTLQEFLYLRNNVEGTARSINMSVSGLKYRLQKIEKILGNNLRDYKVCFDLQLALIILQLFGEYRI